MPESTTIRLATVLTLALGPSLLAAACGGDDDGEVEPDAAEALACSGFEACGGSVTGTWAFTRLCYPSSIPEECPEGSLSFDLTAEGSFTFDSDMTYEVTVSLSGAAHADLPASCLEEGAVCAEVDGYGTCVDDVDADGCRCSEEFPPAGTELQVGTWSVDGDALTLSVDGQGEGTALPYCVDGDRMRISEQEGGIYYELERQP